MKNYSLQTYKGIATRHVCPNCGDKRSFVYYVDEENTTTPAVAIITLPSNTFTIIPHAAPLMPFLLMGKREMRRAGALRPSQ